MSSAAPIQAGLIILGALLLIAGVLTWRLRCVIRHRRESTDGTPTCATCRYNLTGLTSNQCPECGTPITPTSVVRGDRPTPRQNALLALLCAKLFVVLLGSVYLTVRMAEQVNWYQYRPAAWLLQDLQSTSIPAVQRAMNELGRRHDAGKLGGGPLSQWIDLLLDAQAGKLSGPIVVNHREWLGRLYLSDPFTDTQRKRFFEQMLTCELQVRPKVALGDRVPYRIVTYGSAPDLQMSQRQLCNLRFYRREKRTTCTIDGRPMRGGLGSSSGMIGQGEGSISSTLDIDQPGEHEIIVTIETEIIAHQGPGYLDHYDDPAILPCHVATHQLKAKTLVLAEPTEDLIRPIRDASHTESLRKMITPENWRIRRDYRGELQLDGRVRLDEAPPVPVAFEVFAVIDGRELQVGSFAYGTAPMKTDSHQWHMDEKIDRTQLEPITLILRGSEAATKSTVDLFSYWDGELVYENVAVEGWVDEPGTSRPD